MGKRHREAGWRATSAGFDPLPTAMPCNGLNRSSTNVQHGHQGRPLHDRAGMERTSRERTMVKMISRRTWLSMAGGMSAAVLALAATYSTAALADTLDDIKKAGTIKVGVGVM